MSRRRACGRFQTRRADSVIADAKAHAAGCEHVGFSVKPDYGVFSWLLRGRGGRVPIVWPAVIGGFPFLALTRSLLDESARYPSQVCLEFVDAELT